eukprot:CAMPEP_0170567136 /NCGR_PEP_ID=MMETSP0211-20121228/80290_1 /TAXON_ID=311385 /ORGANISM="Pseudokeronopsis sp., Strain OXSARD2" /LENGTH=72 /DNA_ID=CAMNT_0010888513 /DNA_START=557 /DNA_END=775 /DNA_ORIENTATION=+
MDVEDRLEGSDQDCSAQDDGCEDQRLDGDRWSPTKPMGNKPSFHEGSPYAYEEACNDVTKDGKEAVDPIDLV